MIAEVVSLPYEREYFGSEARLKIGYFATWYVGFGSFEDYLSEDSLALRAGVGSWEGSEIILRGGGEGRPVCLPVVGIEGRSEVGQGGREPATQTDENREVIRV